jgi:hypothetical protein
MLNCCIRGLTAQNASSLTLNFGEKRRALQHQRKLFPELKREAGEKLYEIFSAPQPI